MRFAALFLTLAGMAAAQVSIPDTPAGKVATTWLDAFNSGDRSQLAAYVEKYDPTRKDRINSMMDLREQTGGFQILRVEKSEPRQLTLLVKEKEGSNFAMLTLQLNDADPPSTKFLRLNVVPRPSDQPAPPRLALSSATEALDKKAAELAAAGKFSGAVLIAHGGDVVFKKAYGLADREGHVSNTPDTQFRIGSMNKMFTATAVLQLVGAGKIDLAAPVGKYLPDYPNQDFAAKVTIRHLLTHTGGAGDIFGPEYDEHRLELRELADYVKLYGSRGPQFEPGSKWSYANYGFLLLGYIVEKVSGVSYYDYVRKNVFEPAGMRSTDSLPEEQKITKRSNGYMRREGTWVSNADTLPWRGTSAGGGYSTVEDLYRFARALSSGKLIKPALFAEMTSKQAGGPQMPPSAGYGFGMMVQAGPEGKRFGHGGGAPGMNGELRVYPQSGMVVVTLANQDPPAATRVADYFEERMPID